MTPTETGVGLLVAALTVLLTIGSAVVLAGVLL